MLLMYETLPIMCLDCGKIGHLVRECHEVDFGSVYTSSVEWKYSKLFKAQLASSQHFKPYYCLPSSRKEASTNDSSSGGSYGDDTFQPNLLALVLHIRSSKGRSNDQSRIEEAEKCGEDTQDCEPTEKPN